ncbi:uncharacterized protein FOMMEDRAFT_147563 [Fomitiporia mediterranea MF3/22]|uniref:uncharacterized protein n=1 Tax=Fomitiporia mediterranea (strain MF3/22) TaxID=694068 RepID=UPI000440980A|nr:uncharacterized protein FOMMEDRAFT_147563 [Fomitiporia mediterranea MF3/22]EJD00835.1 hypothetical protein FOMMEDRAFT_147563 [Fomitiporia mediterranea MF3/22]
MDAYFANGHSSWLANPGPDQPQTSSSPGPTQNGNDEWAKTGIDLSDFGVGLGDLQAPNSSPTNAASLHNMYQFPVNGPFFSTMAPFNIHPYGHSPPPSGWPSQNLPLSSYSTLNGATTTVGSSQQQQQQVSSQPPASAQQPMIDPALTSASSAPSYSPPPPSASQGAQHSSTIQFNNVFHHHQQQPQVPHSPTIHQMSSAYLMHQQQQQQQQRTLNPQQLTMPYSYVYPIQQHHVQSPMQTNLTATSSHTSTPPPASSSISSNSTVPPASASVSVPVASDPLVFKQKLDRLLTSSALSDANTVHRLMDAIADHGNANVTPEMRAELASRIRDGAGNAFFAAWARDAKAMALLLNWLKAGVTGKDEGRWDSTVMPLLHVLDRLPLTISLLKEHRPGKLTNALLKSDTVSPAIKDMASNIANKWRTLIEPSSGGSTKDKDASSSSAAVKKVEIEDKTKKRKLADGAPKPPSKVAVVSSAANSANAARSAVKVKKEKVVVTAVKDAKADASFFSAPKPKPRLPSFKKAPAPATTSNMAPGGTSSSATVAQPSQVNAFEQALKEMKGRATAVPIPPVASKSDSSSTESSTVTKASTPDPLKNAKKRKSVSWAPEGHLEKVRIIEKAVYDDDPADATHGAHSIRDLERAEGAAMHFHLFEEVIDWYKPQDIEFPSDIDSTERGGQSEEKSVQEEREKNTLRADYYAEDQIPETPGEPLSQIALEQVDTEARTMVVGADIQPFFQHAMSVADLVGQLAANTNSTSAGGAYGNVDGSTAQISDGDVTMSNVNNALGVSGGFDLSKLDPNALSNLAASLGLTGFNFAGGAGAAVTQETTNMRNESVMNAVDAEACVDEAEEGGGVESEASLKVDDDAITMHKEGEHLIPFSSLCESSADLVKRVIFFMKVRRPVNKAIMISQRPSPRAPNRVFYFSNSINSVEGRGGAGKRRILFE